MDYPQVIRSRVPGVPPKWFPFFAACARQACDNEAVPYAVRQALRSLLSHTDINGIPFKGLVKNLKPNWDNLRDVTDDDGLFAQVADLFEQVIAETEQQYAEAPADFEVDTTTSFTADIDDENDYYSVAASDLSADHVREYDRPAPPSPYANHNGQQPLNMDGPDVSGASFPGHIARDDGATSGLREPADVFDTLPSSLPLTGLTQSHPFGDMASMLNAPTSSVHSTAADVLALPTHPLSADEPADAGARAADSFDDVFAACRARLLDEMEKMKAAHAAEISNLGARLASARQSEIDERAKHHAAEVVRGDAERAATKLREELANANAACAALEAAHDCTVREANTLRGDLAGANATLERAQRDHDDYVRATDENIKELREQITSVGAERDGSTKAVDEAKSEASAAEARAVAAEAQVKGLTTRLAKTQELSRKLNDVRVKKNKSIKELKASNQRLQDQIDDLNARNGTYVEQNAELRRRCQHLEQERDKLLAGSNNNAGTLAPESPMSTQEFDEAEFNALLKGADDTTPVDGSPNVSPLDSPRLSQDESD